LRRSREDRRGGWKRYRRRGEIRPDGEEIARRCWAEEEEGEEEEEEEVGNGTPVGGDEAEQRGGKWD